MNGKGLSKLKLKEIWIRIVNLYCLHVPGVIARSATMMMTDPPRYNHTIEAFIPLHSDETAIILSLIIEVNSQIKNMPQFEEFTQLFYLLLVNVKSNSRFWASFFTALPLCGQ